MCGGLWGPFDQTCMTCFGGLGRGRLKNGLEHEKKIGPPGPLFSPGLYLGFARVLSPAFFWSCECYFPTVLVPPSVF